MDNILLKYNAEMTVYKPRYTWFVKDDNGLNIFHCEYHNNVLIIRLYDVYGNIIFRKDDCYEDKIEDCINFCKRYYAEFYNLTKN